MKIFENAISLAEIERLLEEKIIVEEPKRNKKESRRVTILGSLGLTYEDYRYLLLKLKGVKKYGNILGVMERYRLSLLTAMVFAIRNGEEDGSYQMLKEEFLNLPQHQIRQSLLICQEAFEEYAIHSFGMDMNHFEGVYQALAIHAGVSEGVMYSVC